MGQRPQYRVIKFHDDEGHGTEVGAAWPLNDEKDGFSIEIKKGIAVAGRLTLLPNKPREPGSDDEI